MFSKRQRVCEGQIGRMLCASLKLRVRFLVLGLWSPSSRARSIHGRDLHQSASSRAK